MQQDRAARTARETDVAVRPPDFIVDQRIAQPKKLTALPDTNLLERSLGEVKRRTKVIGRSPGETSCLTLVRAVLDLYVTHATNGISSPSSSASTSSECDPRHDETTPEEVSAA